MPARCAGCAFTPGTDANQSLVTLIKAKLCVQVCESFYCHENAVNDELPEDDKHLCRGWGEAVNTLYRQGHYERLSDWRRHVLRALLGTVIDLELSIEAGTIDQFDVMTMMQAALEREGLPLHFASETDA